MRLSITSLGIRGYVKPWNLAHNSIVRDRTKAPHRHPLLRGEEQGCPKLRQSSWLCGKGPRRDQTHKSQSRRLFLSLAFTSFTPTSPRICGILCLFFLIPWDIFPVVSRPPSHSEHTNFREDSGQETMSGKERDNHVFLSDTLAG